MSYSASPRNEGTPPPNQHSPTQARGDETNNNAVTGVPAATNDEKSNSTTIFVGNLPFNIHEPELESLFNKFGKLKHVKVGVDRRSGRSLGYGFVEFEERKDAEEAFKSFHKTELYGRNLRLDWDLGIEKKRQMGDHRGGRRFSRRDYGRSRRYSPYGGGGRRYSPYGGGGGRRYSPYGNYRARSPRRYSRSPPRRRISRSPPRRYPERRPYDNDIRGRSPSPRYREYDQGVRSPGYSPRTSRSRSPRRTPPT
jgi:RNA recognition motif-containing protein